MRQDGNYDIGHQHHQPLNDGNVVEEEASSATMTTTTRTTTTNTMETSSNSEDEFICRICRENGNIESLVHPCKCSGSIRYVHEKCLLEWIEHSKSETCELCKHKFKFAKVYKSDAPQKLNLWELVIGSLQLGKGTLQKLFRLAVVLVVWSFITPVLTAWILRVFLSVSMEEFVDIPKRIFFEIALFQDCLIGAFLAISILVLTIFIAGVREFINDILRNLNDHLQQNGALIRNNVEQNNDNVDHGNLENEPAVIEQPANEGLQQQQQQQARNANDRVGQQQQQIIFQDEMEEDEAVDLEEFIGLKGSFISLLQNCTIIILMNALYLFCLVFAPFTIGRCVLVVRAALLDSTDVSFKRTDILTKLSITAAGYMFTISVGLFLFLVLLILQRLFYNNSLSRSNISYRTLQLWLYIQTVLKVTFVSSFNFVITPICCGAALNLATAEFFGSTVQDRIRTISNERISFALIHWFMGLGFLFNLSSTIRLLRSIIRRKVLWFLNDPDDPNFSFVREAVNVPFLTALRRIAITLCLFVFLILALVRAPLKLCKSLRPSTFPLSLMFSHPFLQISIDIIMYSILTQIGLENIRPQLHFKIFVEKWLHAVGKLLDLNDYLFPRQVDESTQLLPERQLQEQEENVYKPPLFPLRMALLLVMAWSTATIIFSALILIPLLTGRALILISPSIISMYFYRTNDLYTHLLGSYAIGATILAVTYIIRQIRQQQMMHVLSTVVNYAALGVKCIVLGALWFMVIPVLLGLAFEMSIVIPVLMSDKTALMPLSELWAFGIFLSGICVRFTYMLRNIQALESWRIEFDRVAMNGAQRLEATRVFMNIIFPIIFWLTLFICLPYLFAKQIAPLFVQTRLIQHRILICSYPTIVFLFLCSFAVLLLKMCWNKLHESIRDRRYLIRRSVVNLENETTDPTRPEVQQDSLQVH